MARGRQIVRQWKVLRALEAARHRGLTAADLLEQLGEHCSQRTLYRDLDQLQEAGFPLLSDDGRWRVLQSGEGGWSVPIEPTEVLALSLVDDLLAPLAGSYLAEPLRELRGRLMAMLSPANRAYLEELRQTAVATLFGPGDYSDRREELAAIGVAIGKQHRLRLRYAPPSRPAQDRVVDPYATWYASGRVYLIAYCHRAGDIRTFAVQRIEGAEVLDEAFEPDADFDPGAYSRVGFGVLHGPVEDVAIAFAPEVAHLIRERRFHASQRLLELEGGGLRLEMRVAGLPEVAAWVAGYGAAARPLAPEALVEAVRRLHEGGLRAAVNGEGPEAA
jgi:predicted DNA-binding transcriptional regulator YafY